MEKYFTPYPLVTLTYFTMAAAVSAFGTAPVTSASKGAWKITSAPIERA